MFDSAVHSKSMITLSVLVIAVASLFASDPILGNQQALAANAAGSGFGGGGGSFVSGGSLGGSSSHAGFVGHGFGIRVSYFGHFGHFGHFGQGGYGYYGVCHYYYHHHHRYYRCY